MGNFLRFAALILLVLIGFGSGICGLYGLGAVAVDSLVTGRHGVLCGMIGGTVTLTPLVDVVGVKKALPATMLELARVLSR